MIPFWLLTVICWLVGHEDVTVMEGAVHDHVISASCTRQVCTRCRRSAP